IALCAFFLCAAAPTPIAPKTLGTFGAWTVFAYTEKEQKTCYMVAHAQKTAPMKKIKTRSAWITITQRPDENSTDVFSYSSGYNFDADGNVIARIGKNDFILFPQKDPAWSRDAKTDRQITAPIRRNATMTIAGLPANS